MLVRGKVLWNLEYQGSWSWNQNVLDIGIVSWVLNIQGSGPEYNRFEGLKVLVPIMRV